MLIWGTVFTEAIFTASQTFQQKKVPLNEVYSFLITVANNIIIKPETHWEAMLTLSAYIFCLWTTLMIDVMKFGFGKNWLKND